MKITQAEKTIHKGGGAVFRVYAVEAEARVLVGVISAKVAPEAGWYHTLVNIPVPGQYRPTVGWTSHDGSDQDVLRRVAAVLRKVDQVKAEMLAASKPAIQIAGPNALRQMGLEGKGHGH